MRDVDFRRFVARHSPEASRALFENLVVQVVRLEGADARQIDIFRDGGGDGGLDVMRVRPDGRVDVWQAKFPDVFALGVSQRGKVRVALKRAKATAAELFSGLASWTLAVPFDFDGEETAWWERLSASEPDLPMDVLGRSRFEELLRGPAGEAVHDAYFGLDDAVRYRVDHLQPAHTLSWRRLGVAEASTGPADLPAYVQRTIDQRLDDRLVAAAGGEPAAVLLLGESTVGKTRTAYEAVVRVLPDAHVVAPDPSRSLRALPERVRRLIAIDDPRPVCVWLDDLDRFLKAPEPLSDIDLRRLASEPGVTVLATVRLTRWRALKDESSYIAAALETLGDPLRVDNGLDRDEQERFAAIHGHQLTEGLGAHFLAQRRTRQRLALDESMSQVVELAVDWHRASVGRPLDASRLLALHASVYASEEDTAHDAIQRAGTPMEGTPAILRRDADGRLSPLDWLIDEADDDGGKARRPIQPATWRAIIGAATPPEASVIAAEALRRGVTDAARAAARRTLTVDDPRLVAEAHLLLGDLAGDSDEREHHWMQSLADGRTAPRAATRVIDAAARSDSELDGDIVNRLQDSLEPLAATDARAMLQLARLVALDRDNAAEGLHELLARHRGAPETPQLGEVWAMLAESRWHAGDPRETQAWVAAEELGGLADRPAAHLRIGWLAMQEDRWEEAVDRFEMAVAGEATDADAQLADAARAFEEAGHAALILPLAKRAAARGFADTERWIDALELDLGPTDSRAEGEAAHADGVKAMTARDFETAEAHFRAAAELGHPDADEDLRTAQRESDMQQAAEAQANGDLQGALLILGDLLDRQDDPEAESVRGRLLGQLAVDRLDDAWDGRPEAELLRAAAVLPEGRQRLAEVVAAVRHDVEDALAESDVAGAIELLEYLTELGVFGAADHADELRLRHP